MLSDLAMFVVSMGVAIISIYARKFLNNLANKAADERKSIKTASERSAHDYMMKEINRLSEMAVCSVEQQTAGLSDRIRMNIPDPVLSKYPNYQHTNFRKDMALNFVLDNLPKDHNKPEYITYIGNCIESHVFKLKKA